MTDQIGLFEAMSTQRQITRFKKDPVPREAIDKIIEAATKAPSGGNTQPWEFVVITDPELISKIGLIYKELWAGLAGRPAGLRGNTRLSGGAIPGQPLSRGTSHDPGLR